MEVYILDADSACNAGHLESGRIWDIPVSGAHGLLCTTEYCSLVVDCSTVRRISR
jgi:hypothetical protein